ncbi:MAG: M99 family carboxypeptidase catalytic domain-containing protein [Halarcobacter sp.]
MLKLYKQFLFLFILTTILNANDVIKSEKHLMDFDFIKKGIEDDNTLLVIGGIQGDEPGGFMAASLLVTHYDINKGSVWIVPNLNFYSIIKRSRGPYGDMNRKFAYIETHDPDYKSIMRIKSYITADDVKLILNLHDGSGYYRPKYKDWLHSPNRWGQSSIIDQISIDLEKYGNLEEISAQVVDHVNKNLIREKDYYSIKNTETRLGDKEMEKSLTYFAINNGKAAFANETSKSLPLHERVYYHLLAIEKYMQIMGIEYKRKFLLEPQAIKDVIDNDIYISFYDNKIQLPLSKIRSILRYFPIKKDGTLQFSVSNPLMTVLKEGEHYVIHYGNREIARLSPDYMDIVDKQDPVKMVVDGKDVSIDLGSVVNVKDSFLVNPISDIRVNVIGFLKKGYKDEAGLEVSKKDFLKRYSVDENGNVYRVEFYKKNKFIGMVLVNFDKNFDYENLSKIMFKQESKEFSM